MRLDTTVVETNIHYPTDSNLLGDGVRVLIRAMRKIAEIAGSGGAKLRDRSRSVKLRLWRLGVWCAPKARLIRTSCSRDTTSCWMQRAGWWGRPSASARRSSKA